MWLQECIDFAQIWKELQNQKVVVFYPRLQRSCMNAKGKTEGTEKGYQYPELFLEVFPWDNPTLTLQICQVGDTVDSSLQSTADRSLAPFTGMSLRSETDSTKISALFDSNTTVSEMKSSRGVMDVF